MEAAFWPSLARSIIF